MDRYAVTYNGKIRIVKAESASEAIDNFLDRPLFGEKCWNGGLDIDLIDADTRGKEWCVGTVKWMDKKISAERI